MKRLFLIILFGFISFDIYSQQWYPVGFGFSRIGICIVIDINSFQGKIVASGRFKKSYTTTLNSIAEWNGNSWEPMAIGLWEPDSGVFDSVGDGNSIVVYNNNLIVAGTFFGAGGNSMNDPFHLANGITKWNGSDWYPFTQPGDGLNSASLGMEIYHDRLYIGGHFGSATDSSGTITAEGIVRWNDTVFSSCGYFLGDFPPQGYDAAINFCVYENKLIAGGFFTSIDGSPFGSYAGIAAYNDTNWSALGVGFNDYAWGLAVLDGSLYAGGNFTKTRDNVTTLNHVAKWDGANWQPLGDGFNGRVNVLCADTVNHLLYAGGDFTQSSTGQSLNHIAVWNGSIWSDVGAGADSAVYALYIKDSNLYVGGTFTHVGGNVSANRIAVWGHNPVGINELINEENSIKIYPNPVTSILTIEAKNSRIENVKLYNVLGSEMLNQVQHDERVTVDISGFSKGIYFIEAETEKGIFRKKLVKT